MTHATTVLPWIERRLPAVAAPAALTALTVAGTIQTHRQVALAVLLGVVVAVTGLLLARTDAVGRPLVGGLAVLALAVGVACWGEPHNFGWFGMCVIAGWAALVLPTRWAVVVGAVLASGFIVMLGLVSREPGWVTWSLGVVLTSGAFVFVRRQRELVTRLHTAQSQLSARARTDERHRIAREMHDLVGHSLTVTLLHLGSARLALGDDPDGARTSLEQAERAARTGLDDVRAAVGLLRTGGPADRSPVPTSTGIAELVRGYRNAGVDVDLDLRGDLSRIAPARGLAAYRITQESLTNAARHGGGAPITVQVDVSDDRVRLVIRNSSTSMPVVSGGTGLIAMRERAAAVGGTLEAGPDHGAWLVEAVIPV